jgi:hypothetical protein
LDDQDPKDLTGPSDLPERMESQDSQELRARRETLDCQESLDHLDLKGSREIEANLVPSVQSEFRDPRVFPEDLDRLDPRVTPECLDREECLEILDFLVCPDYRYKIKPITHHFLTKD